MLLIFSDRAVFCYHLPSYHVHRLFPPTIYRQKRKKIRYGYDVGVSETLGGFGGLGGREEENRRPRRPWKTSTGANGGFGKNEVLSRFWRRAEHLSTALTTYDWKHMARSPRPGATGLRGSQQQPLAATHVIDRTVVRQQVRLPGVVVPPTLGAMSSRLRAQRGRQLQPTTFALEESCIKTNDSTIPLQKVVGRSDFFYTFNIELGRVDLALHTGVT